MDKETLIVGGICVLSFVVLMVCMLIGGRVI